MTSIIKEKKRKEKKKTTKDQEMNVDVHEKNSLHDPAILLLKYTQKN
jgi:hypothetical protein